MEVEIALITVLCPMYYRNFAGREERNCGGDFSSNIHGFIYHIPGIIKRGLEAVMMPACFNRFTNMHSITNGYAFLEYYRRIQK